jgi:hypothetical protein
MCRSPTCPAEPIFFERLWQETAHPMQRRSQAFGASLGVRLGSDARRCTTGIGRRFGSDVQTLTSRRDPANE